MDTNIQNRTLVAVFNDYESARKAVQELESDGISKENIDLRSNLKTSGAGYSESSYEGQQEESGFAAWWHGLFGGDEAARADEPAHYDEALRRGHAVVTVHAPDNLYESAVQTLNEFGAVDIDRRVDAWREDGYAGYDSNAPAYTSTEAAAERNRFSGNTEQAGPLPVVQEELQVGKRVVQQGGVRVYSRVVDQPVEEQINLREERVRVERRPADRAVSADELGALRDQTIEVTQMSEEPVISKRARVTEEVFVGKDTTERTETVRDSVRHTEVVVDELQGSPRSTAGSAGRTVASSTGSEYGTRYAIDPRFNGKPWDNVEQDIRTDYLRSNPNSSWEEVKGDVRSGWDKAVNRL